MIRENTYRWLHKRLSKISTLFLRSAQDIAAAKRKRDFEKKRDKLHPGTIALNGSAITVREAIAALQKMEPDDAMWVVFNSGERQAKTGCGYIGYYQTTLFGNDEPSWIPVFSALSPESEERNRPYHRRVV